MKCLNERLCKWCYLRWMFKCLKLNYNWSLITFFNLPYIFKNYYWYFFYHNTSNNTNKWNLFKKLSCNKLLKKLQRWSWHVVIIRGWSVFIYQPTSKGNVNVKKKTEVVHNLKPVHKENISFYIKTKVWLWCHQTENIRHHIILTPYH